MLLDKTPFIERLRQTVLVLDGAMGTGLHARELSPGDYLGHENCSEILNETRPDVIEQIHRSFLAVGCDGVETNTFGANRVVLGEYDLAGRTYDLNLRAAEIAGRAVAAYSTPEQPRYVIGSIGPGTKLVSLRQISYDELVEATVEQMSALLAGGVDALLIETCQDILQTKAAIAAARQVFERAGRRVPLMCQVTMETTGTMLLGTDIAAAVTALEAFPEVDVIGLNCATGPQEMSAHVRYLGAHCTRFISVLPNAGLPQLLDGRPHFPLTPAELARWLTEFVEVDGVNVVGGCCGTQPAHLAAVVQALGRRAARPRQPAREPAVSSLYYATEMRQDQSVLLIGERCNTNGSRQFKRLLANGDLDALVAIGRAQVDEGAHVLDVCVDCVGRDGPADMHRVVDRFAREIPVPLMLDSTEPDVLAAGLKLAGGKCIINSVNLEDGEEKLARVAGLARQFGAALVALTIDDDPAEAMAKTAARKLAVAGRLYELLTGKHGIAAEDIFFDCLTFPITTGNAADRRLALETLEGVAAIRAAFPRCQTSLGISNVSFGLQPAARVVLNSAFLAEAQARGLTAAIVHASKILPQTRISPERWEAALDLIYDRGEDGSALERFIGLFAEGETLAPENQVAALPVEERLRRRIINGARAGLEQDLGEALERYTPFDIINTLLLDGMKAVGELFGSGQMQLPFVLKSAETMKAAVAWLEPHMRKSRSVERGRIVLATVRGDVHDIGKNLVDIILSNNGYKVFNLGIKQPIANIIDAFRRHEADVIGLSGLLVKSTLVMRDDLHVLNEQGISAPVILGGAALTRRYVEEELRQVYRGPLYYAKDAFDGLALMRETAAAQPVGAAQPGADIAPAADVVPGAVLTAAEAAAATARDLVRESGQRYGVTPIEEPALFELPAPPVAEPPEPVRRGQITYTHPVPTPPFWGDRVLDQIPLRAALEYLNEVMLFQVQWQFRKRGRSAAEFEAYIDREVRPIYRDLVERCERERILLPQAVYGYWPCNSEGDDLIVYDPPGRPQAGPEDHGPEIVRFTFPRQAGPPYRCLADFWRPVSGGETDVVAFSIVTAGRRVSEVAAQWFHEARFQEYLFLHGLGVETAEALAEYIHKRIRVELGIAGRDAQDKRKIFQQGYQGSRYSFGYPACPDLEDQAYLMVLLEPTRIGVELTEVYQLEPEQSTTAMIAYHPEARYFGVR